MRSSVLLYLSLAFIIVGSLGVASAMLEVTVTVPHPGPWPTPGPRPWPSPLPPHPTWTSSTSSSVAPDEYNTLCGFEMFFWKVYSDTVFSENYVILKRAYACTPARIMVSGDVNSLLASYYMFLYTHSGDVYRYLAMRDYPFVVKFDKSVPSPGFDPILYAKFERYVRTGSSGEKSVEKSGDSICAPRSSFRR